MSQPSKSAIRAPAYAGAMDHQNTHPFHLCMDQHTPQTRATGFRRIGPTVKVPHHVFLVHRRHSAGGALINPFPWRDTMKSRMKCFSVLALIAFGFGYSDLLVRPCWAHDPCAVNTDEYNYNECVEQGGFGGTHEHFGIGDVIEAINGLWNVFPYDSEQTAKVLEGKRGPSNPRPLPEGPPAYAGGDIPGVGSYDIEKQQKEANNPTPVACYPDSGNPDDPPCD